MRALWLSLLLAVACAQATVAGSDGATVDVGVPIDAPATDAATDAPAIDASTCANQPCDVYSQCGCAAAAPVCDLDPTMLASGATACRTDMFGGTEPTLCTRSTTCAAGHSCVGGRCRRFCETDGACPGDGAVCIISVTTGNPPVTIPGVTMCTTSCTPTSAANPSCPTGWACHVYFDTPGNRYLTDCAAPPATGGAAGATCASSADCRPGLDCITLNPGGPQCRPTCLCTGGNCAAGACPAGTGSCRGFMTPVIIGAATYGACF
ncbi:MAG: hypothetical protein R3B06_07435 [Kofleriaceae bacterium]